MGLGAGCGEGARTGPGTVQGRVPPEGRRSALHMVLAQDPCPASVLFVKTGKGGCRPAPGPIEGHAPGAAP